MAITDLVATSLGFGSLTQMIGTALEPKYGIYIKKVDEKNGNPLNMKEGDEVFIPSSWIKHELIADSSISNAPVEGGSYTSFNKVMRPSELRVVFAFEGWMAFDGNIAKPFSSEGISRTEFIQILTKMRKYAYTYNIVTPDIHFPGFDLTHFDYQVSDKSGVTLLLVNAFFQRVMDTVESSISSSTQDSGTTTTSAGIDSPTLDEAKIVDSNIVQSTDSLGVALAKVAADPISNLRSAVTTVGSAFSDFSQTNAGHVLKSVVTGISKGLM